MQTSIVGSAVNAGVVAAVTVPAEGSWETLGWTVLSAVLGAVMSWLSSRFK